MKKVFLSIDEHKFRLFNQGDAEPYILYVGINQLYGNWLMETGGDPTCLNELEDVHATNEINQIEAIIADSTTPWENCDDYDVTYVNSWLKAWGLLPTGK